MIMTGLNYFNQSGIVKEGIHNNFVFKEKNIMLVMIFFFLILIDFHTYCNIVVKTKGLYIMRNIFSIIM